MRHINSNKQPDETKILNKIYGKIKYVLSRDFYMPSLTYFLLNDKNNEIDTSVFNDSFNSGLYVNLCSYLPYVFMGIFHYCKEIGYPEYTDYKETNEGEIQYTWYNIKYDNIYLKLLECTEPNNKLSYKCSIIEDLKDETYINFHDIRRFYIRLDTKNPYKRIRFKSHVNIHKKK